MTTPAQTEIQNWLEVVNDTVVSLSLFRAWLQAWHDHPALGSFPVDFFDSVIADLRAGGLASWLTDERIAGLKKAVCGGEK